MKDRAQVANLSAIWLYLFVTWSFDQTDITNKFL